jgi:uncharacterized phage-associated protein
VRSSFDVALWLYDRALNDNEYLQPQKLHRLLYLAQAYWAVAHHGRKLMPAVFVAEELGPVEPTLFHAFENGRPSITANPLSDPVKHFMDSVWRRFGAHSAEHLNKTIGNHAPYVDARNKGIGVEIPLAAMTEYYTAARSAAKGAPGVTEVLRPRVMRSQDGKPVSVNKWMPPVKK